VEPIKCLSQCKPDYPAVLQGEEGSAKVIVAINDSGVVTDATLATAHRNGEVNRQALLAAKQMRFSAPKEGQKKSVPVVIHFTVAGSDFDRQARERRQQQDQLRQAARQAEEEKANQERKARLEAERQARQRQLEKERQERLKQLSVESAPSPQAKPAPVPEVKASPPEPTVSDDVQIEGLGEGLQLEF
jgi:TonB family protein